MVPAPGLGVDRLAHRAQQAQGGAAGRVHRGIAVLHQGADGGGGGVEDIDLVLVDHVPEARDGRIVGHALEHDGGGRIRQRAIDAIRVARHPAHIGGAPIDLARTVIEHILVRPRRPQQIAAGGVQHALGLAGRTGGIEDEQRVLGIHRLGRAIGTGGLDGGFPVDVAALDDGHIGPGVFQDQNPRHARHLFQRLVDIGLQRHLAAPAAALVGGDDKGGAAVFDTARDAVGREAAENDRMDGSDTGAGQHGIGRFRHHGHIEGDAVALLDPLIFQHIGQTRDLIMQFAIGDLAAVGWLVTFPDDGDLILASGQVAVDAVGRDVQHPVLEPLDAEVVLVERHVLDPGREGHPVQALRHLGPVGLRSLACGRARLLKGDGVHLGAGGHFGRDRIDERVVHAIFLRCWRVAPWLIRGRSRR